MIFLSIISHVKMVLPAWIRTRDPSVTKAVLYPAELWERLKIAKCGLKSVLVDRIGFEPTTLALKVPCSTAELPIPYLDGAYGSASVSVLSARWRWSLFVLW